MSKSAMPSNDVVEEMARAMWYGEPDAFGWSPSERHTMTWEQAVAANVVGVHVFRALARAAAQALLKRLREPTAEMVEALYGPYLSDAAERTRIKAIGEMLDQFAKEHGLG